MRTRAHIFVTLLLAAVTACTALAGCDSRKTLGKSCTLYLYLCGSDLESEHGLASANLDELIGAQAPDEVSVIVQTGGSTSWRAHDIDPDKLQRFEVRDGSLHLIEEQESQSMGNPDTLRDFLTWGSQNYPAERNILVLWDHGGKSADKICFDERYDNDALERAELGQAFSQADLPFVFDTVILDACYMATIENAALLSDYAHYLIASQEVIPSGGLDYGLVAHEFAYQPDDDLGRAICDAYLQKSQNKSRGELVELSLMDLSKTDELLGALDDVCAELAQTDASSLGFQPIPSAAWTSTIYGTRSSSNLLDLTNFLEATRYFGTSVDKDGVLQALDEFVIDCVQGSEAQTVGVSVYYPVNYDEAALRGYLAACPLKHYAELLDNIYGTHPAHTITFKDKGSISKSGDFCATLSKESLRYLAAVVFTLYRQDDKSSTFIPLGAGCDLYYDTDTQTYTSAFDGAWPSFAGTPLYTTVDEMLPRAVTYTSPVRVNGEDYVLASAYAMGDEEVGELLDLCYVWGGYDENGIPSRSYYVLEPGDTVEVYGATDEYGMSFETIGTYTVPQGLSAEEVTQTEYLPLPDGTYRYQFLFGDIFGEIATSDYALLHIQDGQVSMDEVQPSIA